MLIPSRACLTSVLEIVRNSDGKRVWTKAMNPCEPGLCSTGPIPDPLDGTAWAARRTQHPVPEVASPEEHAKIAAPDFLKTWVLRK